MAVVRLPYRLQQVVNQLSASSHDAPQLSESALNRLTPPMLHQFRILDPADQHHLIRVHDRLVALQADEDTITAGLIHDVGKACAKCHITVFDRGMHVILSRFAGPLYRQFARIEVAPEWIRGLHRLANHPERGALAAQQAGYSARVAELVRYHEDGGNKNDAQLELLRYADNQAERDL